MLFLHKTPVTDLGLSLTSHVVMPTRDREGLAFCSPQWDKHSQVRRTVLLSLDLSSCHSRRLWGTLPYLTFFTVFYIATLTEVSVRSI